MALHAGAQRLNCPNSSKASPAVHQAGRRTAPAAGCLRSKSARHTFRASGTRSEQPRFPGRDGRSADDVRRELEARWLAQDSEAATTRGQLRHVLSGSAGSGQPSTSGIPTDFRVDEGGADGPDHLAGPFAGSSLFRAAASLSSLDGSVDEDVELWTSSTPASLVFGSTGFWGDLDQVYVILFGVGSSDTEGIYSLRALSRDDALPQDTIIAFEDAEDAERYAGLLEATMDHLPSVCPIDPHELLEFCVESGYSCRLEARGSLLIPPDYNVGVTDWERSLRLREGRFSVVDADDYGALGEIARRLQVSLPPPGLAGQLALDASWGADTLDEMRARLERLLPDD